MTTSERRRKILEELKTTDKPIAAKDLAAEYGVSRQVIVQDMAVIRASSTDILSTNRGYILQKDNVCSREFKVHHEDSRCAEELNLIVDCGGAIRTVSVSHRVYGRITAEMDIRSRQDVNDFLGMIEGSKSSLLSGVTSGYHYHLVEAASGERLDLIAKKLEEAGFLVPYLPWENDHDN